MATVDAAELDTLLQDQSYLSGYLAPLALA